MTTPDTQPNADYCRYGVCKPHEAHMPWCTEHTPEARRIAVVQHGSNCNHGNRCPWSDGDPSYCRRCGDKAQGSGR